MLDYANHAVVSLSQYASQYENNSVSVDRNIINFDVDMGGENIYDDNTLRS